MAGDCFGFVEDAPSASVLNRLVAHTNKDAANPIHFRAGFPAIRGGCGDIRQKAGTYVRMARNGLRVVVVVDLDTNSCAPTLIREWFGLEDDADVLLPEELVFRVAVREIESWIMADRSSLADYLGIPVANLPNEPDDLPDPKQELLSVIRRKGRKAWHKAMLPQGPTASIGPTYNERLCEFVERHWDPVQAAVNSSSLRKAMAALKRL